MATRENFRLETRLRVAADNIAVEAILMVIEDAFGRGSVNSGPDADGNTVAEIRCAGEAIDARRANWLHGQLATMAKYLLEATDVTCADDTGREQPYRLEPAAPGGAAGTPDGVSEEAPEEVEDATPAAGADTDDDAVVEAAESAP